MKNYNPYNGTFIHADYTSLFCIYLYNYAAKNNYSIITLTHDFLTEYVNEFVKKNLDRIHDIHLNGLKEKLEKYYFGVTIRNCTVNITSDDKNQKIIQIRIPRLDKPKIDMPYNDYRIDRLIESSKMIEYLGLKMVNIEIK